RQPRPAVDVAADDAHAQAVVVLPDRFDQVLARPDALGAERVQPLAQLPAVVAALDDQVDLLVEVLAHVAGPQDAGLAVERHTPDVAQPVRPRLRPGVVAAHEGVVLGDGVILAVLLAVHV